MGILKKLHVDGFILALLGVVALGALIPTSGLAAEILSWATKFAIGLLFFMYGARLSTTEVWAGLRSWRLLVTGLVLTFVMYPALGLAIDAGFGRFLPDDIGTGIVFLALVPATVQTCISYTAIARGNVSAAIVAASMSSAVGVFVTPLLVAALLATSGAVHVDLTACIAIVLQLLLPFVVGQLVHRRIGGFMKRHDKLLRRADRSFVLLVVFSAFSAGTAAGIWGSIPPSRFAVIVALCVGLFATALTVSATIGRLLRFAREDRIVLIFVGTSKSITAGLPIAAVLFTGPRTALIILPLMIYHQVQLIACTFIAQRMSRHAPDEVAAEGRAPSASDDLLRRLRAQLPAGDDGGATWIDCRIDEPAQTAAETADAVAREERHDDPRPGWHLAARMGMFSAGDVGALVVEVEALPALERFATSPRTIADKQRLMDELQSAGMLDSGPDSDEVFAELLTAAGDHPIRVVACDTQVELGSAEDVRRPLHTAKPYMAALISRALAGLPPGRKLVALVGALNTNSVGGVDEDILGIDFHPGDAIYYPDRVHAPEAVVDDDFTLVDASPTQRDATWRNRRRAPILRASVDLMHGSGEKACANATFVARGQHEGDRTTQ